MQYLHRVIENALQEYRQFFSAVAITGPRQSGKSTLLRHALPDYEYVTFDDPKIVSLFYDDPEKFMRIYAHRIIFDEAQRVPELFHYLKLAIDTDRDTPGKFIITGSSQLHLTQNISESLAGRIGLLSLLPYQYSEIPNALREQSQLRGAYPELINKRYRLTTEWYASYVETYLSKDVRSLANVGDIRDFQRFLHLLAANTAQIINMAHYANDIGVDVKTIKRWLSILEASYIIFLLPPYYNNYGKRITKSPKVYFYDTGLVCYLVGLDSMEHYQKGPMAGALFENYIILEILKRELHRNTHSTLYYYRTNHGVEVDLIIKKSSGSHFIEIKCSETFSSKMSRTIEQMITENESGFLIYQGKSMRYLPNVAIINFKEYLST